MSDERQDRPQYGEYATPEEQRARIRQPDATLSLDEGVHPGTVPAAAPQHLAVGETDPGRRGRIDRIVTFALLALGALLLAGLAVTAAGLAAWGLIRTYPDAKGAPFFPEIDLTFRVGDGAHYHVPVVLSPYGYSTYRGN